MLFQMINWRGVTRCAVSNGNTADGKQRLRGEAKCPGESLRQWVEGQGGWLHPKLGIIQSKEFKCRGVGVIAEEDLVAEADKPLLIVPEALFMTSDDAREALPPLLGGKAAREVFQNQTASAQLALLVAYERTRVTDSRWRPYIEALPPDLPNGWAIPYERLTSMLPTLQKQLGLEQQSILRDVDIARRGVNAKAEVLLDSTGAALGISKQDYLWAFGQVVSRSFGSSELAALLPLIDICNHGPGACRPSSWRLEDGEPAAAIYGAPQNDSAAAEGSEEKGGGGGGARRDEPVEEGGLVRLRPGEELLIAYNFNPGVPLMSYFLNFGFVPLELAQQ
eukprot:jgi/Botrbrau1/1898/Bobra.0005s0014.1